jgi:hypothetical protein
MFHSQGLNFFLWLNWRDPGGVLIGAVIVIGLLSPYGTDVLLNFGGNYYPEVAILAVLVLLLGRRVFSVVLFKVLHAYLAEIVAVFAVLAMLAAIGGINHGDWIAAYADLRGIMAFFITAILVTGLRGRMPLVADSLLASGAIASLVLFAAFHMAGGGDDDQSVKLLYPSMAVPLMLAIAAEHRASTFFLVGLVLAIFVAVTSFYRSIWVINSASIVLFSGMILFRGSNGQASRKPLRSLSGHLLLVIEMAFLALLLLNSFDWIVSYLTATEKRYIHSIAKLQNLLDLISGGGFGEGDDIRRYYLLYLTKHWYHLLLPTGLGHEAMVDNIVPMLGPPIRNGNTLDSTWLFLCVHFGLIIGGTAVLVLGWYLAKGVMLSRRIWHRIFLVGGGFLFFFYASTTAAMLTHIPSAIIGGAWIGYLLSHRSIGQNFPLI